MKSIFFLSFILTFYVASGEPFTPVSRPYNATHYKISLELDPGENPSTFEAETTITVKGITPTSTLVFDAEDLKVNRVKLISPKTGKATFESTNKTVTVHLSKPLEPNRSLTLELAYSGQVHDNNWGFFKVTDPDAPDRGTLLFTQFEPQAARNFFPCNDDPSNKATVEMITRVPNRYQVISNGKLISDKKQGKENHVVHWSQEKPISTYLVALGVGPFTKVIAKNNKDVSLWVGAEHASTSQYAADVTADALTFFEGFTGVKYPWAKYATVGVPTFIWGGMENTSNTFMNEERLLLTENQSAADRRRIVGLTAHELAHQWFGDLVTMKWWDDVWLNEAFATYMSTLAEKHIFKNERPEMDVVLNAWNDYFRQENGPESHPIQGKQLESPQEAFDSINYIKGANVLRMLSFYVGEEKFRRTLNKYLSAHSYANATYLDFFKAASAASGENLDSFRDSWIVQRGYPVVTYSGTWDGDSSKYQLTLAQRANHPEDNTTFTFRIPVTFHRKSAPAYDQTITLTMNQPSITEPVNLLAQPEWVTVNPGAVVLAKVEPQERDEKLLALQATTDPDPISRVWAGMELASGLLEGDSISSTAERALLSMITDDQSPYVRSAMLGVASRMKARWLPSEMGDKVFELAKQARDTTYSRTVTFESDPYGWIDYRAHLLTAVGRSQSDYVLPFLTETLQNPTLTLDDLTAAAQAVASLGDPKSAEVLKSALAVHKKRGYRYEFAINFAFGALENTTAAAEIREIAKTARPDLMGRIGWAVKDNQVLKNSPEWAAFLKDFVLQNDRFDDEVKSRILHTIEEVKNESVHSLLQNIVKDAKSDRLKSLSKKMLEKNFPEKAA
jgi:hypothetical protein